jgi:spermidine/putrescine ABC transporter ATP-binding subunit
VRTPDVRLDDVTKSFGDVVAVDAISLAIEPGEFFSLLGPSGCGKTTTLRMIGGFEFPSRGSVFLRGHNVTMVPPNHRATNMVFQHLALFPHLNVFENIAFGLRLAHRPRAEIGPRVGSMLKLIELEGYEGREIRQLSGGQKQRVAIARALVNEPAVLLLDEPLGALDLKLRLQMQTELKTLQGRLGTTFVYVTHDQGEALSMSDRIAVMRDGRIEQIGTSEEIYAKPRNRFVATFIGEANLLDGVVIARSGATYRVQVGPRELQGESAEDFPPGARVTVVVRPEHIKVGQLATGAANVWPGHIRDLVFMGSTIRYRIAVGDLILTVEAHNDEAVETGIGSDVSVGWEPRRTLLVER